MTVGAQGPLALVRAGIDPEILQVVVECRWQPRGRRMTRGAIMAEIGRHMIWIGRSRKV